MLKIAIFVTQSEVPKTDLTLADFEVDVFRVKKSDKTTSQLVSDAALHWGVGGFYGYYGPTPDYETYDYFATCEYVGAQEIDAKFWTFDFDAEVSTRTTLGVGATAKTYTVKDGGGTPIPDVDVWVTSDVQGSHVIAQGKTNQNGQVTFWLDSGTVYVWSQKSGWNFDNPDTEVVP
ncbi:hypothetical protein ACFLXE_05425 [Chloroflexota bacterium]